MSSAEGAPSSIQQQRLDRLDRAIVDFCDRVFRVCERKFPLHARHSIGLRIGHYIRDYRGVEQGARLEFPDGTSFPASHLLAASPRNYTLGSAEPEITIPVRTRGIITEPESKEILTGQSSMGHEILPNPLKDEIRERIFYAVFNRFLHEKGLDVDVKASTDMVGAFTSEDHRAFLRRYLATRLLNLSLLALVSAALTIIHIIFVLAALPSVVFALRIYRKVWAVRKFLDENRGGEYLERRIKRAHREE